MKETSELLSRIYHKVKEARDLLKENERESIEALRAANEEMSKCILAELLAELERVR